MILRRSGVRYGTFFFNMKSSNDSYRANYLPSIGWDPYNRSGEGIVKIVIEVNPYFILKLSTVAILQPTDYWVLWYLQIPSFCLARVKGDG